MCNRHYEAARLRGGLEVRSGDPTTRFWSAIHKTESCWLWTAARSTAGYGRVQWKGRLQQAHRVAYEMAYGPIPDGLDLDHLCRNRACVRPTHLDPVTRQVNLLRGETVPAALVSRTECRHGHKFTPENTYMWRNARYCVTCRKAASLRRKR